MSVRASDLLRRTSLGEGSKDHSECVPQAILWMGHARVVQSAEVVVQSAEVDALHKIRGLATMRTS